MCPGESSQTKFFSLTFIINHMGTLILIVVVSLFTKFQECLSIVHDVLRLKIFVTNK